MTAMTTVPGLGVIADYIRLFPLEAAAEAEKQDASGLVALLGQLSPESAGALVERLAPQEMAKVLELMPPSLLHQILAAADPARLSIGLAQLNPKKLEGVLESAPEGLRKDVKELMTYEDESAGRLMNPQVISFRASTLAGEALRKLRSSKSKRVHDVYVADEDGLLEGYAPIQELALADPSTPLRELARKLRGCVGVVEPKDEVVSLFEQKKLSSIPVVNHEGRLVGVIHYSTLISAAQEEALEGLQAMVGVSRDEKALSPAFFAVKKRLPWLQINLVTAFLAAAVVGLFEDTIAKVTALAVLLPVVAGQSGNTGAQALAVAIRGLTLKEIRISQWMRLVRKEVAAGFMNGMAVALVTGVGVWFWSKSFGLVMVIVCSMIISMVVAGGAGAAIPVMLKACKQDPAQSSSIVLTTVTDVVGFFSFLGIATVFMRFLPQG